MLITVLISLLLSIFSTVVMSYISMAIPIGPWIAPTLVLVAMGMFKVFAWGRTMQSTQIALATCAGSIGGILATGFGFSFPAIYFLDATVFNSWLAHPSYFALILSGLAFTAGGFGLWISSLLADKLVVQDQLAFPVGQLVQKMIAAKNQTRKSLELAVGFLGTALFCILQDGFWFVKSIIAKSCVLVAAKKIGCLSIPLISLEFWPLLWAIGFVTGHMIALPLAVGALTKIFIIDTVNKAFFMNITAADFLLAFCSGMVLAGALQGFVGMPKQILQAFKNIVGGGKTGFVAQSALKYERSFVVETLVILGSIIAWLTYSGFSLMCQAYLVLFTFIVTYQLAVIAGKIGLAPLGRFATFVMVPAMFLFKLSAVQIIIIATFVEVCGGVAADALFGRKIAQLGNISCNRLKAYQYFGLLVSALSIGIIFWLLINHFSLGSQELCAQKAQARALLINVNSFNLGILALGLLFGFLLKFTPINPALLLSGILMPINLSLGLIVGGFVSALMKNREEWYPFWSGVFASNSIWMLLKTLV